MTADTMVPELEAQPTPGGPGMSLIVQSLVTWLVAGGLGSAAWWAVSPAIPLFSDASTTENVGIGAILVVLGGALAKFLDWVAKFFKDRSEEAAKKDDRVSQRLREEHQQQMAVKAGEIAHLEKLMDRETAERQRLQTDMSDLRKEHRTEMTALTERFYKAEIKASRAVTWIRSMEGLLRAKKVEYIPFDVDGDDDDSDDGLVRPHGPVPPTNNPPPTGV